MRLLLFYDASASGIQGYLNKDRPGKKKKNNTILPPDIAAPLMFHC